MANYSYSTPYTGQQVATLPPGYMEAATAPGRNLAMGIASMGQNIGKAIEQYRTKKADTESATQSWETVSGLMQQQLASDPKYLAIQQYTETGQLPAGISEQDIPRYTKKVEADREMLKKFSSLGEKFPDMSLAKKKAALGDAVMVLNQYRTDQQKESENELRNLQLSQLKNQIQTLQQTGELMRYGFTMPTTQQVTEPTSEMLQPVGPVQTPMQAPPAPAFNEQGYMQALKQYQNQPAVGAIDAAALQAQLAQLAPQLSETPGTIQIPSLGVGLVEEWLLDGLQFQKLLSKLRGAFLKQELKLNSFSLNSNVLRLLSLQCLRGSSSRLRPPYSNPRHSSFPRLRCKAKSLALRLCLTRSCVRILLNMPHNRA